MIRTINYIRDMLFVSQKYYESFGHPINWLNPKRFTEKLNIFKISREAEKLWPYVDKFKVRNYVKQQIGKEYLIPLIGGYKTPQEINFDRLPNKFVIKANHGTGWNIIRKDKKSFDITNATFLLNSWLNNNFYRYGREVQQ